MPVSYLQGAPGLYAGGVRLAPVRIECGEPSLIVRDALGEALRKGGDSGLCEGVDGIDLAFVALGDNFSA